MSGSLLIYIYFIIILIRNREPFGATIIVTFPCIKLVSETHFNNELLQYVSN